MQFAWKVTFCAGNTIVGLIMSAEFKLIVGLLCFVSSLFMGARSFGQMISFAARIIDSVSPFRSRLE